MAGEGLWLGELSVYFSVVLVEKYEKTYFSQHCVFCVFSPSW